MKIKLLISLLFICSYCCAENTVQYRIEGKLTGTVKGKYAYLQVFSNTLQKAQLIRASVVNGSFVFTGTAKSPDGDFCKARVFISDNPGYAGKDILILMKERNYDCRSLVLEKKVLVKIEHSVKESVVIDGEPNNINNLYEAASLKREKKDENLRKWYESESLKFKNDVQQKQRVLAEYYDGMRNTEDEFAADVFKLIAAYPSSKQSQLMLKALFIINGKKDGEFKTQLERLWKEMPESFRSSKDGEYCQKLLSAPEKAGTLNEGDMIPEYVFKPDNSEPYSMKTYRGKYVFLDFWTSWCGPCRAEHFYMKKAYEKFKSKNFIILQYSFDTSKEKWLKALKEEELPWTHLRDMKGWNKEVQEIFDVQGVPTNYLIGPDGKIIAKNLRGEALEKKLSELFGH